ncbi:MAG: chromosome segregation protein SMC, partial [Victivallis vadensis]
YAREMPEYHDVPDVPLSAADLIRESQDILNRNTERDRLRSNLAALKRSQGEAADRVARLREELERAEAEALKIGEQVTAALAEPIPENESTAELEAKIADIDTINAKIRANSDKEKAQADADDYKRQLDQLTAELEAVREERRKLLDTAEMPLDELAIGRNDKGRPILLFNNQPWDCMSGMERIRTAVAVVRKLKPACGFVLIDAIEAFDLDQLRELDRYLEEHHLQAIATRVSRGDECSIIIEDGVAVQPGTEAAPEVPENNTANNMGEW